MICLAVCTPFFPDLRIVGTPSIKHGPPNIVGLIWLRLHRTPCQPLECPLSKHPLRSKCTLMERSPTERSSDISTPTVCPLNIWSTVTFVPSNILKPSCNIQRFNVHPPLLGGQHITCNIMSNSTSWIETCCPPVTKPAQNCVIFFIAMKVGSRELPISKISGPLTRPSW